MFQNLYRKLTVLILLFLISSINNLILSQEKARVFGKITDSNGNPLEFVNVAIFDLNVPIGAFTDKNGKYSLTIPANVNVNLVVSFTGFETEKRKIYLLSGETKEINFRLQDNITQLPEFIIKDKSIRTTGFNRLDPKNVTQLPSVSGGVEALIKLLPGVSSNNELSSQYNVRGGNYDENLVYVNDIEIYRPFLVRSGQQEGLSFINSDMVSSIQFSAGGYDAKYGDKMSSVLDIKYKRPSSFAGNASLSLLGGALQLEGTALNSRFAYLFGLRQKSNQYLLSSLETKGEYRPSFTDVQTYLSYNLSERSEISFLGNLSRNIYNLVPQNRETDFGTVNQALRLKIYFDGQEVDKFETYFGAISIKQNLNDDIQLKNTISLFNSVEKETFDIQGQYWLYQLEADFGKDEFGKEVFNRGIGTYIDHARNYLNALVYNIEHRGIYTKKNHLVQWGIKYQREEIDDKLSEWKLVDSSGYSLPYHPDSIGSNNPPKYYPELQNVYNTKNEIGSNRITGFIQDSWSIDKDSNRINLSYGARFSHWDFNNEFLLSPRATISYKPRWEKDVILRISSGIYYQTPFYRELRNKQGIINKEIKSQKSVHFVAGFDWNLKIWDRPFKFISEVYYKFLDNLIPYEIDNVRIRYLALNNAKGYARGIDFRLNGEFVKGIESWASLSFMQTEEDIENDSYIDENGNNVEPGYIPRPTDQRLTFSLYFQDYLPRNPNIKMHLNLVFGTCLPFGPPNSERYKQVLRMPSYRRVDIGSSFLLKGEKKTYNNKILKHIKTLWLSIEIFNLLQVSNTISYIWVSDITNRQYAVPNYLTPRQLNLKLVTSF